MAIGTTTAIAVVLLTFRGNRNNANLLADIGSTVSPNTATATPAPAEVTAPATTVGVTESPLVTNTTTSAGTAPLPVAATATAAIAPQTPIPSIYINQEPSATIPTIAPTTTSEFRNIPSATTSSIKTLPYVTNLFGLGDGWENWWGGFSETSGALTIGADASTTGGGARLAGTSGWSNYLFGATLDWIKGESFGILADVTPDADYVACEFNQPSSGVTHMYLDEYSHGQGTTLASTDIPGYTAIGGTNIAVSIMIQGTQGTCTFNGHSISNGPGGKAISIAGTGGIGFTTWDQSVNNSEIVVKSINVNHNQL